MAFKQLSDDAGLALFAPLMRGAANTWFNTLPDADRADYNTVITRFRDKYAPASITMWRRASEFWSRNQRPTECVEEYMSEMLREAHEVSAPDDMIRYAAIRGLRAELRTYVMQQNPATTTDLLEAAKIAEATVVDSGSTVTSDILEAINRLEHRVAAPVDERPRSPARGRSPARRYDGRSTSLPCQDRRVRVDDGPPPPRGDVGNSRQPRYAGFQRPQRFFGGPPPQQPMSSSTPRVFPTRQFTVSTPASGCTNCARTHDSQGVCPAAGKFCRYCGKRNHFFSLLSSALAARIAITAPRHSFHCVSLFFVYFYAYDFYEISHLPDAKMPADYISRAVDTVDSSAPDLDDDSVLFFFHRRR